LSSVFLLTANAEPMQQESDDRKTSTTRNVTTPTTGNGKTADKREDEQHNWVARRAVRIRHNDGRKERPN